MLPAAIIDPTVRATIIGHLALLFLTGAGGDMAAARNAASSAIVSLQPETEDEFALAAETVAFSLQGLETVTRPPESDVPQAKAARQRSSAVNLSRAAHRSRAALRKSRHDRGAIATPLPAEAPAAQPVDQAATERAIALVETAISAIQTKPSRAKADRHAMTKHEMLQRMAENARKNRAVYEAANQAQAQPTATSTPVG